MAVKRGWVMVVLQAWIKEAPSIDSVCATEVALSRRCPCRDQESKSLECERGRVRARRLRQLEAFFKPP